MKVLYIGIISIVLLLTMGFVYAHSEGIPFDREAHINNDIEWHQQHHEQMHGSLDGFEEMHEHCGQMTIDEMEEHHNLMHGE